MEILERLHHDRYLIMRIRKDDPVALEDALDFLDGEDTRVAERWAAERSHDPGTVCKLLATLLASESPAAADAVIRNWRVMADDLVTYLDEELNRGDLDPGRKALAILARQDNQHRVDSLLKRLLIPVNTGKPYDDPIRFRVALLRERRVPAPGALPSTCDALRYDDHAKWQAQFVYALLAEEHAYEPAGSRAVEWARWLCASRFQGRWECPQWVRALSLAVPGAAEIESEDSVRTVLELASDWVPAILRVAGYFDRLPRVVEIPGFDAGLVELGQRLAAAADGDPASADRARQVAGALRVPLRGTGLAPGTIALIDVTRVLLGDAPADFPHGDASDFDAYLAGLDPGTGAPCRRVRLGTPAWRTRSSPMSCRPTPTRSPGSRSPSGSSARGARGPARAWSPGTSPGCWTTTTSCPTSCRTTPPRGTRAPVSAVRTGASAGHS